MMKDEAEGADCHSSSSSRDEEWMMTRGGPLSPSSFIPHLSSFAFDASPLPPYTARWLLRKDGGMATPVVSVVGWHNAGKTTFIVALVEALKAAGYRVAVIKHAGRHYSLDREGTDTWRFARAGSDVVGIIGPHGAALMERSAEEPALEDILPRLPGDLDLIIVEGYKQRPLPKIDVRAAGAEPITGPGEVLAAVEPLSAAPGEAPAFRPEDIQRVVARLVERGLLGARGRG